jgi:hypothetical protein
MRAKKVLNEKFITKREKNLLNILHASGGHVRNRASYNLARANLAHPVDAIVGLSLKLFRE